MKRHGKPPPNSSERVSQPLKNHPKTQKIDPKEFKLTLLAGQYLDMVYYPNHQIGYIYDDMIESTLQYNHRDQKCRVVMKGGLPLTQAKLLKKDKESRLLFIRTGKTQITIINAKMNSPAYSQINLKNFEGTRIQDFQSVSEDRLLTVTDSGHLNIYKEANRDLNFVIEHDHLLTLSPDQKECVTCLKVCAKSKFVALCTKNSQNQLFRLIVMDFSSQGKPRERYIVDLSCLEYSRHSESYFYDINMDFYLDEDPILLCFQRYAENKMIPLVLRKKVELVEEPLDYHTGLFAKCVFDGRRWVWSVDAYGILKRLAVYRPELASNAF